MASPREDARGQSQEKVTMTFRQNPEWLLWASWGLQKRGQPPGPQEAVESQHLSANQRVLACVACQPASICVLSTFYKVC